MTFTESTRTWTPKATTRVGRARPVLFWSQFVPLPLGMLAVCAVAIQMHLPSVPLLLGVAMMTAISVAIAASHGVGSVARLGKETSP